MKKTRGELRKRRHLRTRQKVSGTAERPRLCVHRGLKNMYAQIIDDEKGVTIAAISTVDASFGKDKKSKSNINCAKELGKKVALAAQEKKVVTVVFDKAGYRYHGRIKALADAAREAGLKF
ncbi:MAG: 50S ribosomal protein L18 [Candidatus Ancaeobacter aquaticus]|nr:50S ribosomal protein L18 [Candidatus Ancaeobacter aquaticus]